MYGGTAYTRIYAEGLQRCYRVHTMKAAVQETLQAMEDMVYIAIERLVVHKEVHVCALSLL